MSVDINAIAENLAELLSNSTNIASNMYDLFVTTEEMDVTLQQYDENNVLQDVVIPNLAKARRVAKSGHGSPEGVVVGNIGNCYVDMDYNYVYFKVNGNNTNTGWIITLTEDSLQGLYVPSSRTINGKTLSTNINLTASDIGALADDTQYGYRLAFNSAVNQIQLLDVNGNVLNSVSIGTSGANKDLSDLSSTGNKKIAPMIDSSTSEKFLTNDGSSTRWDVAHVDNVESSKFSTTLTVTPSSGSSLVIQNDYNGTKDSLGTETETLTYDGTDWVNSSSQVVQLSDYQLSITSGTPVTGDSLGLLYTTTNVSGTSLKFWTGNNTQYGNISVKDNSTVYIVTGKGIYLGSTAVIIS